MFVGFEAINKQSLRSCVPRLEASTEPALRVWGRSIEKSGSGDLFELYTMQELARKRSAIVPRMRDT